MKLLKFIAIFLVGVLSVTLATYFTNDYVAKKAFEEKTLAEAIIENKLRQELEKAEEEVKKELGEQLVTTAAETKPITVTTTTIAVTTVTTATNTTTTTTTTAPEEEIKTEFTRGGILPSNRDGIGFNTMFTLSEGEQERLTRFLIDHYFLYGNVYVRSETRPALKEKKAIANEMESNAIAALNRILGSVNLSDRASLMTADYAAIYADIEALSIDFSEKYRNSSKYGEEFGMLYENCANFFDRLLLAVERLSAASKKYNETTNSILAAIVLASTIEDVIIPEILGVLDDSFGLIEITQDIFLEGTTGKKLLSREEVKEIITNPALVLNTGLA